MDSILNQTYSNLHLILIDDGSTDNSSIICDNYVEKDSRIKAFHQKNSGVANARNKGLECSDEEYIMFVDADDYVEATYVYDLYHGLIDHNADISITDGVDEDENGSPTRPWNWNDKSRKLTIDEYDWNGRTQHPIVWGALFKRNLIGNIRFDSKYYVGEDSLFFAQYLKNVKNLYYVHDPLYHYVHYGVSAINGQFDDKKITELYAWKKICEEYDYRYDIAAAYAIRCKGFCLKYYSNSLFREKYFNWVIQEYKKNVKALELYYRKEDHHKALLMSKAFTLMPRLYCKLKKSE